MPIVYLAGPINGLDKYAITQWRETVKNYLHDWEILSPLRYKESYFDPTLIPSVAEAFLLSSKGVMHRDRLDVKRCDVMIANFTHAKKVSIGSCVEFGWASAYDKPIVTILDNHQIHNHPIIRELSLCIVENIEQACDVARSLF